MRDMESQVPTLDAGVTYLDARGFPALHRVVGRHLDEHPGPAYWVDARNAASSSVFRRCASRRAEEMVRVARAFTGYQHYELVRGLPARVRPGTSLVVAPNVGSPYADGDVPDAEADAMFDAVRELLEAVASAVDAAVLVTARADDYREQVAAWADHEVAVEHTREGTRFESESFRTDVYWYGWGFQTTIPYWVDLLGAVDPDGEPAVEPPGLEV